MMSRDRNPLERFRKLVRHYRRRREFRRLTFYYRHLDPEIVTQVERWFRRDISEFTPNGDRSVSIAHPTKPDHLLKIKGAGLRGRGIRFGRRHDPDLRIPLFDFEGRMMDDHAAGYDNAPVGGASFQQCANEYEMSARLAGLGYNVLPCLGYGRIDRGNRTSWFCVLELEKHWKGLVPPRYSIEEYVDAHTAYGHETRELAVTHRLLGHYWYLSAPGAPRVIKDLHAFRHADPVSMSRTSWAMHVFHSLHLTALSGVLFARRCDPSTVPEDFPTHVFRAFHPDVTKQDHEAVRWKLVPQYMKAEPADFDPVALNDFLHEHILTRAILDACPEDFAAF